MIYSTPVPLHDLVPALLAPLTALRDEQPVCLSCLAFGRTLPHGVDLAGRSLADLFAGSSVVTDRNQPAHYVHFARSTQRRFVVNPQNSQKQPQEHRPKFSGGGS